MSEIIFNSPSPPQLPDDVLLSQIQNLQTTLASLNQQVIILQEAVQERDQQIVSLQANPHQGWDGLTPREVKEDNTLTILGVLINLYKFIFLPQRAT